MFASCSRLLVHEQNLSNYWEGYQNDGLKLNKSIVPEWVRYARNQLHIQNHGFEML